MHWLQSLMRTLKISLLVKSLPCWSPIKTSLIDSERSEDLFNRLDAFGREIGKWSKLATQSRVTDWNGNETSKLITTAIIWALSFVPLVSITDTDTFWWSFLWHCPCKWVGSYAWLVSSPTWEWPLCHVCGIGESRKQIWLDQRPLWMPNASLLKACKAWFVKGRGNTTRDTHRDQRDLYWRIWSNFLKRCWECGYSGYEVLIRQQNALATSIRSHTCSIPRENVETKLIETIKSDTVLSNELVKDALTELEAKSVPGLQIDLPWPQPFKLCGNTQRATLWPKDIGAKDEAFVC